MKLISTLLTALLLAPLLVLRAAEGIEISADSFTLGFTAVLTTTTFGIFLREFSPLWVRVCWTSESFVDGCKPS